MNDSARHDIDSPVPGTVHLVTEIAQNLVLSPKPSEDPNDPLNWSLWRKSLNFFLTLVVTIVIFAQLSIQTVFWQQMIPDLDLTYSELNISLAVNYAGTACGCIIFIPFAIKFGRRPVYLVSTFVMAVLSFWTAEIHSKAGLYATNLLCGLAGSPNETLVQMTIVDLFFVHQRSRMSSFYSLAAGFGSFLVPIPAGAQAAASGWRWSYLTLGIFNAAIFIVFLVAFEETKYVAKSTFRSSERVHGGALHQSAAQQGTATDKKHSTTVTSDETMSGDRHTPPPWKERLRWVTVTDESLWKLFWRPLEALIFFAAVAFTAVQYGFSLMWIAVITSVQAIWMPYAPYNFNTFEIGLLSLPPWIGLSLGALFGGWVGDKTVVFFAKRNHGVFEPEMRLYPQFIPGIIMTAGLLMFGLAIAKDMPWPIVTGGTLVYGFGWGSGINSTTYSLDSYTQVIGEAFVGVAFVRNIFSVIVLFALAPWIAAQGLYNMFVVMGVLCLFVCALYIPMIYVGKQCRRKSARRYARMAAAIQEYTGRPLEGSES